MLRTTPPNLISIGRLLVTPILFVLIMRSEPWTDLAALLLLIVAALSDFVDGWLARRKDWISEAGIYLDPAADKLLVAAAFLPFYLVTGAEEAARRIPHWGQLPFWVLLVVLGREVLVAAVALVARWRGTVVPAETFGKWKSTVEFLFSGGLLLWWVLTRSVWRGAPSDGIAVVWAGFHGALVAASLAASVALAVVSLGVYLPHALGRLRRDGG